MSMILKTLQGTWNIAMETMGVRHLPDVLYHPREPHVETLRIPACCQTQTHTCGPVAALMVVRYFSPEFPAKRVFTKANADPNTGTSVARLARVLRESGVRVGERTDLTFKGIVDAIDRGRPIITVVNTNHPDISHWVVLYGYGLRPNRVYLAANGLPVIGQREYPWGIFRTHHWTDVGFGLVCSRK